MELFHRTNEKALQLSSETSSATATGGKEDWTARDIEKAAFAFKSGLSTKISSPCRTPSFAEHKNILPEKIEKEECDETLDISSSRRRGRNDEKESNDSSDQAVPGSESLPPRRSKRLKKRSVL